MKDILINNEYRVDYKIGEGGFGLVYAGTHLASNQQVAIKLTHVRDEDGESLMKEAMFYEKLAAGTGFPKVLWHGEECEYKVLVQEILGPSLEDLLNYCGRRFSLKTTLLIADQAISRLKYIHSKGIVHRDLKPDNFLMGCGKQGNILYSIDFGLAIDHHPTGPPAQNLSFAGTTRYASINSQKGQEYSWGDDMEALGYVLIYLCRGSLPWQGCKAATSDEKMAMIREKKENTPVEELCKGLPSEFVTYIKYARSLKFGEKPDYAQLRRLFSNPFLALGFKHDMVFDWTEKRYHEMRNAAA